MIPLYHFFAAYWLQIVIGSLLLFSISYIIAAVVMALMIANEHRKQEDERKRFERIMAAGEPPRLWPAPSRPKGFDRNRRVS